MPVDSSATDAKKQKRTRGRHAKPRRANRLAFPLAILGVAGISGGGIATWSIAGPSLQAVEQDRSARVAVPPAKAGGALDAIAPNSSYSDQHGQAPGATFSSFGSGRVPAEAFSAPPERPRICVVRAARELPNESEVTLNVYNATTRYRLAANTSWLMADRGFQINLISNDPYGRSVPGVALVVYGPQGKDLGKLVRTQVTGAQVVNDGRAGTSVDLVLGWGYSGLASPAESAQAAREWESAKLGNCATTETGPAPTTGTSKQLLLGLN